LSYGGIVGRRVSRVVRQAASGIDRRNLRGRCGGFRVRERKLPPRDTPSRFGRLPRQRQASK